MHLAHLRDCREVPLSLRYAACTDGTGRGRSHPVGQGLGPSSNREHREGLSELLNSCPNELHGQGQERVALSHAASTVTDFGITQPPSPRGAGRDTAGHRGGAGARSADRPAPEGNGVDACVRLGAFFSRNLSQVLTPLLRFEIATGLASKFRRKTIF